MATEREEGKLFVSLESLTTSVKRGVTTAFTRARQSTEEWLGQAERTGYDTEFERMAKQADDAKMWTERMLKQTEVVIRPSPNERLENFIFTKLDRPLPNRPTPADVLGQHMIDASTDIGATPYGKALLKCGQAEQKLGSAQRDLVEVTANEFIAPLRRFLNEEMRTINLITGAHAYMETSDSLLDLSMVKPTCFGPVSRQYGALNLEVRQQILSLMYLGNKALQREVYKAMEQE